MKDGRQVVGIIVPTIMGKVYVLEYAADLSLPEWSDLLRTIRDGTVQMLLSERAGEQQGIYRVCVQ